jgi:hypothetical protein
MGVLSFIYLSGDWFDLRLKSRRGIAECDLKSQISDFKFEISDFKSRASRWQFNRQWQF